jgi:hypothetical protein
LQYQRPCLALDELSAIEVVDPTIAPAKSFAISRNPDACPPTFETIALGRSQMHTTLMIMNNPTHAARRI